MKKDIEFMKRALEIALLGTGKVSPNPRVGAVLVKNHEIISEGWHRGYGSAHAEVEAINNANLDSYEDTTLYITLESCCHIGKTPACTDMILEKKIPRVVIAMQDPNPFVNGKGIEILKQAGIRVDVGVMEEEANWLNRFFIKQVTTNTPYILLKIAQTLDGCIATNSGDSKWISCESSRKLTHKLRNEIDAVLIGRTTASADNPELTVRDIEGRNPFKVVCDTHLTLPLDLKLFKNEDRHKTIVCCSPNSSTSRKADVLKMAGVNIMPVEINAEGKLSLDSVMNQLMVNNGISSIMVEGGAQLFSSFLKAKLVDEMHIFTAPKILGAGLRAFSNIKVDRLRDAYIYKVHSVEIIDLDVHTVLIKQ